MLFSLDGYGNYGTGYIDLNTNNYVRELDSIELSDEEKRSKENQGTPDWEEGSNIRKWKERSNNKN
jgi:hypothetical protein